MTKNHMQEEKQEEKLLEQERIAELKKKKREMQEELDELKGNTTKGKGICVLVFFITFAMLLGGFAGAVKLNLGGVAESVMAPIFGDVPVLRSILPKDLQRKTAAELAADQAAADMQATADAQASTDTQTSSVQSTVDNQGTTDVQGTEAQATTAQGAATQGTDAQAAAEAQAAADQAAADAQALQDYVDTYSKMKPKDAANVFDNMMPDQEDLVVKILKNMTSSQRAAILSKMNVTNAAELTVRMEQ